MVASIGERTENSAAAVRAGEMVVPSINRRLWRDKPERWVALLLFGLLGGLSVHLHGFAYFAEAREHLGAEYFNIARALADGRGFSDPFAERTGPTAWMPPLYPFVLSALLLVLKTRGAVGAAVAVLMTLTCIVSGVSVYVVAKRCATRISPRVGVGLFLIWVVSFSFWLLVMSTDVWLLALIANFVALAVFDYVRTGRERPLAWGVLGAIAALSSPTLGIAALCIFSFFFVIGRQRPRAFVKAGAIAVLFVAPWALRNAVVFERFIPVKSNLYFEVFQANFVDDDGIYDSVNLLKHPYHMLESRFRYGKIGETAFLDERKKAVRELLKTSSPTLLRNIANRALATVIYPPLSVRHETHGEVLARRAVYAFPTLLWLAAIWRSGPHRKLLIALGLLCAAYLAPYVLVAFYIRYFLVLTPVLIMVSFVALDHLAAGWRRRAEAVAPAGAVE